MRHTIVLSWLVFLATAASAADIGECAAPEVMTARLKAEDQRSVLTADQITPEKELFGIIVTMSSDRRTGYILRADRPLGDRATQICVYNRMANVRVFDARKPGVDPAALLAAPEADALRRCDELAAQGKIQRGACGSLNKDLHLVAAHGEGVAVQGFLTRRDGRGWYEPDGTLATITGRIGGTTKDFAETPSRGIRGGITYSSLPDGASILNAVLVYVEYTPYGLAALR